MTNEVPGRPGTGAGPASPSGRASAVGPSGRWAWGAGRWAAIRGDLLAALPGWVCARAVVLGALVLSRFLVTRLHIGDAGARVHSHEGLMAWDAGFYRGIAAHGYRFGAVPHEALRFFPLVPLAARAGGALLGGRPTLALVVISNVSALAAGALVHRLALTETGDRRVATLAAWLVALAPPAYVLVLGYAEATFVVLVVLYLLAVRRRRWVLAAVIGALAALTRPTGALLAVPGLVEAWLAWRGLGAVAAPTTGAASALGTAALGAGTLGTRALGAGMLATGTFSDGSEASEHLPASPVHAVAARRRLGGPWEAGLAVAGPLLGLGAYLAWAGEAYGDWLLPFSVQQAGRLRGTSVDPLRALAHEGRGLLHGDHVGSGLHVVWTVVFLGLLVVVMRRWPASYSAFAIVTLVVSLSSRNLDSLERYVLACVPYLLAAATLMRRPPWDRVLLAVSGAALSSYALLAFLGAVVP